MRASARAGGRIEFNSEAEPDQIEGIVIDCRGLAARDRQSGLRGVKGELILIETDEVECPRPVRLIHPRFPLYVIPRGRGVSCWAQPRSKAKVPASASAPRSNC